MTVQASRLNVQSQRIINSLLIKVSLFTQGYLVPSLVDTDPELLEEIFVVIGFSLIDHHHPFKKGVALYMYLNKIELSLPIKYIFCKVVVEISPIVLKRK